MSKPVFNQASFSLWCAGHYGQDDAPEPEIMKRLVALLIGATIATPTAAQAQSFTEVRPATCPSQTEVNWTYNISDADGWLVPQEPSPPTGGNVYINNALYAMHISGNEYITSFGVHVYPNPYYFEIVPDGDVLEFFGSSSPLYQFSGGANYGNPISGWHDFGVSHVAPGVNVTLPSDNFEAVFISNLSGSDTGVYLDRARVCTDQPGKIRTNPEHPMVPTARNSGVLLGPNDVAYFTVPVGSAKPGDTCSSAHDTFALWGDPTPGNDFDLYVRCGAEPTPTQWDYRGYSSDSQEFVHATTATCPCGSQWHIAVSAFSGSGWFNLVNGKHYASEHRAAVPVYAVTSTRLSDSQTAYYDQQIGIGFKMFFGANEGSRYWDGINLALSQYEQSGQINLKLQPGRANSDVCVNGSVTCLFAQCETFVYDPDQYGNPFDGRTLTHELGHHVNCLTDEYEDGVGTECGHSIMGNEYQTNTNYCYCTYQPAGINRCASGYGDHGYDTSPYGLSRLQTGTAWINLQSRAPFSVITTPDNYDYTAFDFNGMYGVVSNAF